MNFTINTITTGNEDTKNTGTSTGIYQEYLGSLQQAVGTSSNTTTTIGTAISGLLIGGLDSGDINSGGLQNGIPNGISSGASTTTTIIPTTWIYPISPNDSQGTIGPIIYPQFPPVIFPPMAPMPVDFENLPEGIHDIKGGKLIIKKVEFKDEAEAIAQELGKTPTIDKDLKDEMERKAASEEREV